MGRLSDAGLIGVFLISVSLQLAATDAILVKVNLLVVPPRSYQNEVRSQTAGKNALIRFVVDITVRKRGQESLRERCANAPRSFLVTFVIHIKGFAWGGEEKT